ncbi:MAG: chemotaxis protein CheD [Spirochaetales bacterium]
MHEGSRADYFLNSGELLFSSEECTVRTILGSCVGVALHDPHLRVGGLCHYLLPTSPDEPSSTRYGDVALPYLISRLRKAGSDPKNLRAWIVGGALLLDAHEIFFVGDRNADYAETYLRTHNIRVVANETRGYLGRKLVFHTWNGHLHVETIPANSTRNMLII